MGNFCLSEDTTWREQEARYKSIVAFMLLFLRRPRYGSTTGDNAMIASTVVYLRCYGNKACWKALEPDLVVTDDPAIKALDNATFGKSYEKTIITRDVQSSIGFDSRGSLLPGKENSGRAAGHGA